MFIRSFLTAAAIAIFQCTIAFAGSSSTCLEPVEPYQEDRVEYLAKMHKLIEPAIEPFLQMRVNPSFEPDYSVCLHGSPGDVYWADAKPIFVSFYRADRNIGYSLPKYNDGKDEKVSVAVTTAELPRPVAERIHEAWSKILLRTRYSDDSVIRADPTTIQFSCRGNRGSRYAEAYDAECEDSVLLVELGGSLIDYCNAEADKRAAALKVIEKRIRAVETHLKKRGWD